VPWCGLDIGHEVDYHASGSPWGVHHLRRPLSHPSALPHSPIQATNTRLLSFRYTLAASSTLIALVAFASLFPLPHPSSPPNSHCHSASPPSSNPQRSSPLFIPDNYIVKFTSSLQAVDISMSFTLISPSPPPPSFPHFLSYPTLPLPPSAIQNSASSGRPSASPTTFCKTRP